MTDIVERLRRSHKYFWAHERADLVLEAADEIERLSDIVERLKNRIDTRLNDYLCEMKPGYDDSIAGFNEAWNIVSAVFNETMRLQTSVRLRLGHVEV